MQPPAACHSAAGADPADQLAPAVRPLPDPQPGRGRARGLRLRRLRARVGQPQQVPVRAARHRAAGDRDREVRRGRRGLRRRARDRAPRPLLRGGLLPGDPLRAPRAAHRSLHRPVRDARPPARQGHVHRPRQAARAAASGDARHQQPGGAARGDRPLSALLRACGLLPRRRRPADQPRTAGRGDEGRGREADGRAAVARAAVRRWSDALHLQHRSRRPADLSPLLPGPAPVGATRPRSASRRSIRVPRSRSSPRSSPTSATRARSRSTSSTQTTAST